MAITDFKEIWQGRRGELDLSRATRTYERVFRIVTNSTFDGPGELLADASFLGLLANYVSLQGLRDGGAIVRNVEVTQPEDENPFVWLVRYEFSSAPLDVQQRDQRDKNSPTGQGNQDPITRPPIWNLEPQKYQRPVAFDIYGNAVTNSAGALFSPLPEVDDTRWVLTCERNELLPDFSLILQYQDAVNSDIFAGLEPGTAKISIKAQQMFENSLYYWKVTYVFDIRSYQSIQGVLYSGWDLHLLDRGLFKLDANRIPRKIVDSTGQPVSEPVLLNGQGGQLGVDGSPSTGVRAVIVTNGGAGYVGDDPSLAPTVILTGGGGSGAKAVAIVAQGDRNPEKPLTAPIALIIVTNPGAGYTSAPTVIIGGSGTGATATAVIGATPTWLHYRPHNWLPFAVFNLPTAII